MSTASKGVHLGLRIQVSKPPIASSSSSSFSSSSSSPSLYCDEKLPPFATTPPTRKRRTDIIPPNVKKARMKVVDSPSYSPVTPPFGGFCFADSDSDTGGEEEEERQDFPVRSISTPPPPPPSPEPHFDPLIDLCDRLDAFRPNSDDDEASLEDLQVFFFFTPCVHTHTTYLMYTCVHFFIAITNSSAEECQMENVPKGNRENVKDLKAASLKNKQHAINLAKFIYNGHKIKNKFQSEENGSREKGGCIWEVPHPF